MYLEETLKQCGTAQEISTKDIRRLKDELLKAKVEMGYYWWIQD